LPAMHGVDWILDSYSVTAWYVAVIVAIAWTARAGLDSGAALFSWRIGPQRLDRLVDRSEPTQARNKNRYRWRLRILILVILFGGVVALATQRPGGTADHLITAPFLCGAVVGGLLWMIYGLHCFEAEGAERYRRRTVQEGEANLREALRLAEPRGSDDIARP
jgi:hypothetical protein